MNKNIKLVFKESLKFIFLCVLRVLEAALQVPPWLIINIYLQE